LVCKAYTKEAKCAIKWGCDSHSVCAMTLFASSPVSLSRVSLYSIHGGVEDTKLSTNKQHTLSKLVATLDRTTSIIDGTP
jgi:hypothetical protein